MNTFLFLCSKLKSSLSGLGEVWPCLNKSWPMNEELRPISAAFEFKTDAVVTKIFCQINVVDFCFMLIQHTWFILPPTYENDLVLLESFILLLCFLQWGGGLVTWFHPLSTTQHTCNWVTPVSRWQSVILLVEALSTQSSLLLPAFYRQSIF